MSIQIRNTIYDIRATRHGFSLTEVVIAIGLLAVGMLFIAGSFPVSVHFTTVATERTIAATVADEAFAKIKLYGIYDPNVVYVTQTCYEKAAPSSIADAGRGSGTHSGAPAGQTAMRSRGTCSRRTTSPAA